tara:strand:+ start:58 stop:699 length:642 start_codon:yes stop_codon:yes gene_type:complete
LRPDVLPISKEEASTLLNPYHYLTKEAKGFRSGYNYGAYIDGELLAVCIFHNPSVPEMVKGCFGLERHEQEGIFELGRLVKDPNANETLILSQFVALAIKQLRKDTNVKAILSYADSRYHKGFIYQALNFTYYGMTAPKTDFWFEQEDGSFIKHVRGKVKGAKGEWRPRSRKYRYLITYDKALQCKWEEETYPKGNNVEYKGGLNNGILRQTK